MNEQDAAWVHEVLAQYDVGEPASVEPIAVGFVSRVVIVRTAERALVVKLFSARFDEARVRVACAAHEVLASVDLAPQLLRTREHDTYARTGDGRAVVAEHAGAPLTAALAPAACGALLGRAHLALQQLHAEEIHPFIRLGSGSFDVVERLHREAIERGEDDMAAALAVRLRVAPALADVGNAIQALPSQWIHGDASVANLVVDGRGTPRWVDFDQVSRLTRTYEIARMYISLIEERPDFGVASFRAFLDAYETHSPLTKAERSFLPDAYFLGLILDVREFEPGAADEVRSLTAFTRRRSSRVEWLARHREELLAIASQR